VDPRMKGGGDEGIGAPQGWAERTDGVGRSARRRIAQRS
jgi:hypothetical protein